MKNDKQPLPPNEKRVKYSYGQYRRIRFCEICGEFETSGFDDDNLCPGCGRETYKPTIGRYKIKSVKLSFFSLLGYGSYDEYIIGFQPKTGKIKNV